MALDGVRKTVADQIGINKRKAEKLEKSAGEEFVRTLENMDLSIAGYLFGLELAWNAGAKEGSLTFSEMGNRIAEIGLNFGFDLIVEEGGGNVDEKQRRHGVLIKSELAFGDYKAGNPKDLAQICAGFLKA